MLCMRCHAGFTATVGSFDGPGSPERELAFVIIFDLISYYFLLQISMCHLHVSLIPIWFLLDGYVRLVCCVLTLHVNRFMW